uniref:Odorant receptor n=1 Tax=Anopheles culicifacies TaxID=139723 RepID=A0A182M019_9DIPT
MRSAIDFYDASFNRLKLSSRLIGAGLWEEKYGFTAGRVASITQIVMFLALHAWTGYKHRHNALEMLESQSLICTGVALMIKYFTMIRNRDPVRELSGNVELEMYMKYRETSNEYPVVRKYGRVLHIAGHIMIGGYFGSLFIIWINPLFVYFSEGRVMLLFFCEIPYVDWTVYRGYWITVTLQIAFYITGTCGLILVDYLCAFFTINGSLYVDILRFHLDQLSELLAMPEYQQRSSPEVIEKVDDLHISLVHFPWYLLDTQRQKEYKLLLLRAQQPSGMSIAGLTPVNYETYTQNLLQMSNVEEFRELLKPLIFFSKIIGVEMWTAPGKFLPASYYLSTQMALYVVSTIHTVIKYKNDPINVMKTLVTISTAVQLYIKFLMGHRKAVIIKQLTETIEKDLLEHYQKGTKEEIAVLNRTGRYLQIFMRIMRVVVPCGSAGFGTYPLLVYLQAGEILPLFLYELPFLDHSTFVGYVVNMLFQLNLLVLGTMGLILSDFLYVMCTMYAMTQAEIFNIHLNELEAMLNDPLKVDTKRTEIREKWLQCVYDHQLSTRYFNIVEQSFAFVCLAQVGMGVFTVCDCMLLVVLTDWFPTYGFLTVVFTALSLYFVIGHAVELKLDKMYDRITSMPWYKLPVKEQKEFNLLLYRQQRPMMLTACGFIPMNFETYMSVLKCLYQFFVMVLQYVA